MSKWVEVSVKLMPLYESVCHIHSDSVDTNAIIYLFLKKSKLISLPSSGEYKAQPRGSSVACTQAAHDSELFYLT